MTKITFVSKTHNREFISHHTFRIFKSIHISLLAFSPQHISLSVFLNSTVLFILKTSFSFSLLHLGDYYIFLKAQFLVAFLKSGPI